MRGSEPMPRRTASISAPTRVGQIRQFVHERDARGEHRVGRVLGELRGAHVHVQRALVIAVERRVQPLHQLARMLAGSSSSQPMHDAIGPHEVVDRRAFLQELRIRHDRKRRAARRSRASQFFPITARTLSRRADRHRRLVDDHLEAVHVAADVARRREHVLQVGGAVFVRRRAHRDELHLAVRDARLDVGRELDAAGRARCAARFPARPGSWIGTPPLLRMSILRGSTSRQNTSLPISARHAPVTRPT